LTPVPHEPRTLRGLANALVVLLLVLGAGWLTLSVRGTWSEHAPGVFELLPAGLGATACVLGLLSIGLGGRYPRRLLSAPLLLSVLGVASLGLLRSVQVNQVLAAIPSELAVPPWIPARELVRTAAAHHQTLLLGLMWNGLGMATMALAVGARTGDGQRPRWWVTAGWLALGIASAALVVSIPILRAAYAWQMVVVVGPEGIEQLPYWVTYYLQNYATVETAIRLPTVLPLAGLLALLPLLVGGALPARLDDGHDGHRGLAATGIVGCALCLGLASHHAAASEVLRWCHAAAFAKEAALFGSTHYYAYHAMAGIPVAAVIAGSLVAAPLLLAPRPPLIARFTGFVLLVAAVIVLTTAQIATSHRVDDALPPDQEKGYTLWDATSDVLQLAPLPYTWEDFSSWHPHLQDPSWVAEDAYRRVPAMALSGDPPEARLLTVSRDRVVLVGNSSSFGRRWNQELAIVEGGILSGGHEVTIPTLEEALDRVTSDHWHEHPDTDPVLNVAVDRSIPMSTVTVVRNSAWEAGVDAPAFLVARSGPAYHPNYAAVWLYSPPREGLVEGTPVWVMTVAPGGLTLREPDGTEHRAASARELVAVVSGRASRNAVLLAVHDDATAFGDYLDAVVTLSSVELFPVVFHAWVSVQQQPLRLADVQGAEERARKATAIRDWRTEMAFRTVGDVVVGPVPTDWWVEEGDGRYRRMRQPPAEP
jgi:hypothetical protein